MFEFTKLMRKLWELGLGEETNRGHSEGGKLKTVIGERADVAAILGGDKEGVASSKERKQRRREMEKMFCAHC